MSKPTLTYFNARGRAEIIRLLFAQAGVEINDARFKPNADNDTNPQRANDEFQAFKASGKSVTGQVPFLEMDGNSYYQTQAIVRVVAKKYGLAGADDLEAFQCDALMATAYDAMDKIGAIFFGSKDENERKEKLGAWIQDERTGWARWGPFWEKQIAAAGDGFLVGKSITYIDLLIFDWLSAFQNRVKTASNVDILEKMPAAQKFIAKIGAEPKIKAWVESRPQTNN